MLVSALSRSTQKSLLCSVEIWLLRTVVLVEPELVVGVVDPVDEFAGARWLADAVHATHGEEGRQRLFEVVGEFDLTLVEDALALRDAS